MVIKSIAVVLLVFLLFRVHQSSRINASELYRPVYHYSPPKGWMNDPNGLVFYRGVYHLFFQFNPYARTFGIMHWGHAVSVDLLNWVDYGIALFPNKLGEIFSGCAIVDRHNVTGLQANEENQPIIALFTQNLIRKDDEFPLQQQSLAYSNDGGLKFTMFSGNPIIPNSKYENFRDPKVINYRDHFIMLIACGNEIKFYRSDNLIEWQYLSSFGSKHGNHGGVWECPDLIQMNFRSTDFWILIVSINPGGPNKGSATQYFVGHFDGTNFKNFNPPETELWLDYGPDSYAGESWSGTGPDNRIFISWMNNWLYANKVPTRPWRGQMTSVRTFSMKKCVKTFCLSSLPHKSVDKLHLPNPRVNKNVTIGVNYPWVNLISDENIFDALLEFDIANLTKSNAQLKLCLFNFINEQLCVIYDVRSQMYIIDRSKSGKIDFSTDFTLTPSAPRLATKSNIIKLRLLVDRTSLELFADDGLTVMTAIYFPNQLFNQFNCKLMSNSISDLNLHAILRYSIIYHLKQTKLTL